MKTCRHWIAALFLALPAWPVHAAPLDFTGSPIICTDPAGATVPTPCALTTMARPDGYALLGYSFGFLVPPPGPPPPFPAIVQVDTMRDFLNPVMQDLILNIFGDTRVDVVGAPVLFFVTGTLDGNIVAAFSQIVGGVGNDLSWNVSALVDDVAPGVHTLDMHFGFRQLIPNGQSDVRIASLYQVTAHAVPVPASLALVLSALWLCAAAGGGRKAMGTAVLR